MISLRDNRTSVSTLITRFHACPQLHLPSRFPRDFGDVQADPIEQASNSSRSARAARKEEVIP